ncbi:MAG: aromatic ring-hydroxylating dioxygenase subunit alpha [Gemmatimonadetes bacterium]|nr:MAG: aromatic ring-hydroxylating dioxygenase subunit alpha [Gemmatimonadota bacterium]
MRKRTQRNDLPDFTPENLQIYPLDESETIPSSWYTHPALHTLDQEWIFARTWQGIGHVNKIPKPGDYLLADVAGNSILVMRDKADQLRAFFNVCRHRGGPLATADGHCEHVLKCHYHGWVYKFDGQLRGVPEFNFVKLFDKQDYGLIPIRLDVWEGVIFVHLADDPPPLKDILTGITERIAPIRLETKKFHSRVVYDIACNWKVYVDNYLEGYHLPFVHPELAKLLDYKNYITETYPYYSLQHSPFQQAANFYSREEGEAFYYFVYPNFMLNILPGRLQTNRVIPVDHQRCRVIFDYFYDDVTSPEALQLIEQDIAYSDEIQQEDIEICEWVQRGLNSRAYDKGRFSVKRESGVHHFQSLLKQSYQQVINS